MEMAGGLCRCGLEASAGRPKPAVQLAGRPQTARLLAGRRQQQQLVARRAVDYRTAAPPAKFDHSGTTQEVRSYLTRLGWEKAWIDGITERIYKLEFETTVSRVEDVIKYLEGLGIPTHWVCNMAARVPAVLGKDPQAQLQPVVDYIQQQGVQGDLLLQLLRDSPRLLLFAPAGGELQNGPTRAAVDVVEDPHRGRVASTSYWRDGAAFETAPVSPRKPGPQ